MTLRSWLPDFIPEIRQAWKLRSLQILAVMSALQGYMVVDPTFLDFLPERWRHGIMLALIVYGALSRVTVQPKPFEPAPEAYAQAARDKAPAGAPSPPFPS